jgi:hypothetical protein
LLSTYAKLLHPDLEQCNSNFIAASFSIQARIFAFTITKIANGKRLTEIAGFSPQFERLSTSFLQSTDFQGSHR